MSLPSDDLTTSFLHRKISTVYGDVLVSEDVCDVKKFENVWNLYTNTFVNCQGRELTEFPGGLLDLNQKRAVSLL